MLQRCWWILGIFAATSCFSPQFEDGTLTCGPDGACPPGFECLGGVCRIEGTTIDSGPLQAALTVMLGGNGSGTVSSSPAGIDCGADCTEEFPQGSGVTLTATASAGSFFVGWSGGGCLGTGPCTVMVNSATIVTANFAIDNSIVVEVTGNGSGIVSSSPAGISCGADCTEQFAANATVVLTASPATGSQFDGWSGSGCTGTDTCTLTADVAKMVSASFSLTRHTLTVAIAGNGSGTVTSAPLGIDCGADCSEVVDYNTTVTLTATATAGSTFTGWSGSGCTGTGTCQVSVKAVADVTATFTLTTHQVTVTKAGSGAGTVTSTPDGIACGTTCQATYDYGTTVTLSASPSTGSTFAGWSGGLCTGTDACVVAVTEARAVTATFTLNSYTLTAATTGNGAGLVTSDLTGIDCGTDCSEAYPYNTMVLLTAQPSLGSTFTGWSGACGGTATTCTVTIANSTTATATFTLTTHQLDVAKNGTGDGTISGSGISCGTDCDQIYNYNTVVTLTAQPTAGSTFDGWTGGNCSGTGNCVVTIQQATQVDATFSLTNHQLTAARDGTGSGTVTSDASHPGIDCGTDCTELYGFGQNVTLTATPTTGSVFSAWSGGGCSGATPTCVVPISVTTTVTATFTLTTRTLTIGDTGNGSGSVTSSLGGINCVDGGGDCSEPYNYGSVITLSAVAASGSIFQGWSGGNCTGTGTCEVTLTANTTVTANFVLGTNSMTVQKLGNGQGTVVSTPAGIDCGTDCSENFPNTTMVTLTATASTGSVFSGWSGPCTGTGDCVITISAAVTPQATFTLTQHDLTVQKLGSGGGTVSSDVLGISCGTDCSETYNYNTVVRLSAVSDANATFTGWGGVCSGTGFCDVTMTQARNVTATFALVKHALSVTKSGTGGGTVSTPFIAGIDCGADCDEAYDDGTTVVLQAFPDPGSVFQTWSGGPCEGLTMDTCTVTLTAALGVNAQFALTTHELKVTLDTAGTAGAGSVASSPIGISCGSDCTEIYAYDTDVTLTATPATGFEFQGWSGGGCVGNGACMVNVTTATEVTAIFRIARHRLTVNKAGNGVGTIASPPTISCGTLCGADYDHNTVVILTATADTGSVFAGWDPLSPCTVNAMGQCEVTMDQARSVTATFTLQTYRLVINKTGTGGGLVTSSPTGINCGTTCMQMFNYGQSVTLVATPAAGSTFEGWSGACSGASCSVTITADTSVTAGFKLIPPNYAFVTSTLHTGNLGGLAGADSICQNRANAASLPGTYRAYLSADTAPTTNAIARIENARGWIRTDGRPFLDQASDLTTYKIFYPLVLDENGTHVGDVYAWTATGPNGLRASAGGTCTSWTVASSVSTAVGLPYSQANSFNLNATLACTQSHRLYCFGIDNRAVVAPAPVSARRAFVSTAWKPGGGIVDADKHCSAEATAQGLPGDYLALLSTTTASAISRFDTSSASLPWARTDHTLISEKAGDLSGTTLPAFLLSVPHLAADGKTYINSTTWTGGPSLTSLAVMDCKEWTDTTQKAQAGLSYLSKTSAWFSYYGYLDCTGSFPLVCMQK